MKSPDSAQLSATLGAIGAFTLADAAHVAGLLCAVIGAAYTLWKWRRESQKPPV
jgi:glycine/serine hydroxymethyltransferase